MFGKRYFGQFEMITVQINVPVAEQVHLIWNLNCKTGHVWHPNDFCRLQSSMCI